MEEVGWVEMGKFAEKEAKNCRLGIAKGRHSF